MDTTEIIKNILAYETGIKIFFSVSFEILLGLSINIIVQRLLKGFFLRIENKCAKSEEKKRIHTISRVIHNTSIAIISVITGMLILNELGISIAPILGAAGVVGLAIGFGAQNLVKDMFIGFFLLIENQIRVGDNVEIAGKTGRVEALTLRSTKLRDYNGNVHYISNGLITTVTNASIDFSFAVIRLKIAWNQDIEKVFEIMRKISLDMRKSDAFSKIILEDIEISGVDSIVDSIATIQARIKTEALTQEKVKREYLKRTIEEFMTHEIAFGCENKK